jgi:hypothetical protein
VDQDFLTTDFHSSKSCFFLVSTHPGLINCKTRRPSSFLALFRTNKVQLGPKMAIFELQQEGQTLTKFKNILYGFYFGTNTKVSKARRFGFTCYFKKLLHPTAHYERIFKIRNLYERTLKICKFENSECVLMFLNPKLLKKIAVRLFYDEIHLTKFAVSHSESEFVWEVRYPFRIIRKLLKKCAIRFVLR